MNNLGNKETFLEKPDKFKNGTTFDDVFALYYFDAKVRHYKHKKHPQPIKVRVFYLCTPPKGLFNAQIEHILP